LAELRRRARRTKPIPLDKLKTELFWSHVEQQSSGCMKWIGQQEGKRGRRYRPGKGGQLCYGVYEFDGKRFKAHRVSYEIANGEGSSRGLMVCHRCDFPLCVNPDHLFLGDAQVNTSDMVSKGRARSGKTAGGRPPGKKNRTKGRVTSPERDAIRRAYDEEDVTYKELATRFGLSADYVGRIVRG
jgi:hypothetical protein